MTVDQLNDNLCKDLVVGAFERQDRKFIATRFTYPIGDSVNLYLVGDDQGEQRITDLGTTHYFLRVANIDIDTDARMEFVHSVCDSVDIEIADDFSLSRTITPATANDDVLVFCEAITRISALHYDQKARQFREFAEEVDAVVTRMSGTRKAQRNWTDPSIDPQKNYPIDYHFNSAIPARNVFVVRGRISAEVAIGTMNFYLANKRLDKSMTVVAPDLNLPRIVEKKLEMTSHVIFGANQSQIEGFVTGS